MKHRIAITAICLVALTAHAQNNETRLPVSRIKVAVDVVLVPVTVTDTHDRPAEGLRADDFHIWDGNVEQKIRYFSSEDTPVSLGLVFDTSGSMRNTFTAARSAASTFLQIGNPRDEYFLVEFNDRPQIMQDFTSDVQMLQESLISQEPQGRTAFMDAVYLALENLKLGKYPRKALLMITDGGDNHSRYTMEEVERMLKESDVQLYAIGPFVRRWGLGGAILRELAGTTGGRAMFPKSIDELEKVCAQLSLELKSQYILGYLPSNTKADGKWRKLRVKVNPPAGMSHLKVRAKAGYYATQTATTIPN